MSIKVMSRVWDAPLGNPTDKLVLLTLADYGNDHGSNIYPSITTLARRCDLSERAVQMSLKRMAAKGWVTPAGKLKVKHGFVIRYRIHVSALPKTGESGSPVDGTGEGDSPERVNVVRGTGERGSPNPLLNHEGEPPKGADAPRDFRQPIITDNPANITIADSATLEAKANTPMPITNSKPTIGRDAVETALLRSGKDKSVAALRREAFSPTALDASLEFYRVSGFKVLNAKSRLAGGQQLYEACDGDLSLIEKAFNDLRKSGARITDEYSLVATCNVMASERKRQPAVPVDPDPYVGWEPQPDGSMRRVRASEVKA